MKKERLLIVEDDDVPVSEEHLANVILDADEVELVILHLVGQEIPDIAVHDVQIGGFRAVLVGELLRPIGQNADKRQAF